MLKGIFNSIIYAGRVARQVVAHVARHYVRIQFNHAAQEEGAVIATYAPQAENTLRGRFNGCNDNLGFSEDGEKKKKDSAREALIHALIDMLKEVARSVAEGTAPLAQAFALIGQLEALGIRVSGLPLSAPETVVDHKKAPYIRHVHAPVLAA